MEEPNRLLSGLHAALKRMRHEDGTSYWDTTVVVLGMMDLLGADHRHAFPADAPIEGLFT
jgi:hypothetical protein